ncbi:hypothetical protein B0H67DRAFT_572056 [Lasiosphaeris hirsuta]|uniref:Uncharacterized protein n=1 Tax=Lasiosphaeris hirsuta TaxID=260670 RepID=A0AA40B1Y3_9PEZI|nr:hypothetical protein B0H67DRAFT_572056 [Lasiosphaeris hirsuta]
MQTSDKTMVECLRRCSRIFLRLFPAAFDSANDSSLQYSDMPKYPWPVSTRKLSSKDKANLLELLARDVYCKRCLSTRQAPDWEARIAALTKTYLQCSGCNAEHPACLFSARQRNRTWGKSKRICIGHQGYMRLCEHVTVPWSSVVAEADRRLLPDATFSKGIRTTLAICKRSKHRRSCGPRRTFHEWFYRKLTRREAQLDRHISCCPFEPTVLCSFQPSVAVPGPPNKCYLLVEPGWSGHLPLTMGLDDCFAAEDLEKGLWRLYREQGHFICSQLSPGPVTGSGVCDPNRCDCIRYEGRTQTGWSRPPIEWREEITCRRDRTLGLGIGSIDGHELKRSYFEGLRGQCYWQCSSGQQHLSGGPFDGCYDVQVADIIASDKDADCAVVSYSARIMIELNRSQQHVGQMNANWYHAPDPDSYSLTRDGEGFGVYWCRDEGCRNS